MVVETNSDHLAVYFKTMFLHFLNYIKKTQIDKLFPFFFFFGAYSLFLAR